MGLNTVETQLIIYKKMEEKSKEILHENGNANNSKDYLEKSVPDKEWEDKHLRYGWFSYKPK
jgi:hypothetical protein